HRAADAWLGLRHQEFKACVQHMPSRNAAPGRRRDAGLHAKRHESMIRRVKLDLIDALPVTIEYLQPRRIFVRLHGPRRGLGGTGPRTESGKPPCMRLPARSRDGGLKRHVRSELVYILERWRLVGNVMRFELAART